MLKSTLIRWATSKTGAAFLDGLFQTYLYSWQPRSLPALAHSDFQKSLHCCKVTFQTYLDMELMFFSHRNCVIASQEFRFPYKKEARCPSSYSETGEPRGSVLFLPQPCLHWRLQDVRTLCNRCLCSHGRQKLTAKLEHLMSWVSTELAVVIEANRYILWRLAHCGSMFVEF